VSSLVKLAQLAATDWTAGGIALQTDDYMLAVALSSRNATASIYNQATSINSYQAIEARLADVDTARQLAARNSAAAATESASLKAQSKPVSATDNAKKEAALDAAVAELNAAASAYDAYLGQLSGALVAPLAPATPATPASPAAPAAPAAPVAAASPASSPSSVTLAAILQQKAGFDASQAGGVILLRVHSASGGLYTEKNLWSSFGAMPFYASGGAVVSYSFVKGSAHSAGLLEVVVPYNKVTTVKTVVDMDFSQLCDAEPPVTNSNLAAYKRYCP
jgi:hypothetical protein